MGKLIYSAITSLDGFVADSDGNFDWAAPDEELHAFVNDLERPIGMYLYGRRMYEVMAGWERPESAALQSGVAQDFAAIWKAAEKVVYSTTLAAPSTARTRVERGFDPVAVRALKASAVADLSVGGPTLAASAIRAGLVDECHLFLHPILVGGGLPTLAGSAHVLLKLMDERRFASGVVYLRCRIA